MAAKSHVQQGNYTLSGLAGYEVRGKTIGVVGVSAIGAATARIWKVRLRADQI